jgi:hypothetical protein
VRERPEVASGGVEMVVLPLSEILPVQGVDFVGTIPADLQFVQVFAAAVVKGAKNPEASKRLIDFLASEKATPTVEKWGMKRPGQVPPGRVPDPRFTPPSTATHWARIFRDSVFGNRLLRSAVGKLFYSS